MNKHILDQIEQDLINVSAGEIEMRDDRTKAMWSADIKAFQLSKYPVSQILYKTVRGGNPSTFKGDNRPVETITWVDAVTFCNELSRYFNLEECYTINLEARQVCFHSEANGFRLPTEAEWQYACQAGTKQIRYGNLEQIAWIKSNSGEQTQEVGLKQANAWGFHDMLGNVWEWCTDIYDEDVYGEYRIFRGGGWFDEERSVMATTRRRSHPFVFKIDDLGFRIARNL